MKSNPFEENEISSKSQGGTEITKRMIAAQIDPELAAHFQVIASRVRTLQQDKIRVYWQHDLPLDPEVSHLKTTRNKFHHLVFSSNWQLGQYLDKLKLEQNDTISVIETPIVPLPKKIKSTDEVRLIYLSTPQRGLALLIPVFTELAKKYPNAHLDIYSSFKIYGWEDPDDVKTMFKTIEDHPQMHNHGSVPQEEIRDALSNAHILAYPSIWQETSCRALMESMSAGLICVHPNLAALSDTAGGLTSMYQFCDDPNAHARLFYQHLEHAIQVVHEPGAANYLQFVKTYADTRFNVDKIVDSWRFMLGQLVEKYQDVDSRKLPAENTEVFRYKGL